MLSTSAKFISIILASPGAELAASSLLVPLSLLLLLRLLLALLVLGLEKGIGKTAVRGGRAEGRGRDDLQTSLW